jgi:hypothetical protein
MAEFLYLFADSSQSSMTENHPRTDAREDERFDFGHGATLSNWALVNTIMIFKLRGKPFAIIVRALRVANAPLRRS